MKNVVSEPLLRMPLTTPLLKLGATGVEPPGGSAGAAEATLAPTPIAAIRDVAPIVPATARRRLRVDGLMILWFSFDEDSGMFIGS
jgi:hypothetical protein